MEQPTTPHPTSPKRRHYNNIVVILLLLILVGSNVGWYILYKSAIARPVATVSVSPSPSPTATSTPVKQGTIKGSIGYPAEHAPAQTVCAVSTTDASNVTCIDHPGGNILAYSLPVAPGTYYVYASLKSTQGDFTPAYKAYYNKFVTCGLAASCAAVTHTQYLPVVVTSGATVSDINPTDWYAL